ncbi:hypothetical protein PVK06_004803 [Gossypium arboreum]|uniref:Uncharacterized protein n=1 Tax=Gossypium arboreum TaxID=29729 RepID=A0ABR0QSZ3_GOSAR|nr:hypothetical protein PVK06_004803 [Gossypium arboreum]
MKRRTVSKASKYSTMEDLSQRDDRLLYEDPFSYSQRKVSHFDDSFLLSSIYRKESTIIENCGIDETVGEVLINWQLEGLDVQNNESYKPFHLLDCGENVRMRFEAYECLKTYMPIRMICDGFDCVLQDYTTQLLHVLSKLLVMTLSSQIGEVRGNNVFDPGDHCSLSLFKRFESWIFVVQKYDFRMLHDSSLFPSRNKVKSIYVFDPGIDAYVQFVNKTSASSIESIYHGVTNPFKSRVGSILERFLRKEAGRANNLFCVQIVCKLQVIESNFANFINQGGYDLERFFTSK